MAQIVPLANPPPKINLDTHGFKYNEGLLFVPFHKTGNSLYKDLSKKLAGIT